METMELGSFSIFGSTYSFLLINALWKLFIIYMGGVLGGDYLPPTTTAYLPTYPSSLPHTPIFSLPFSSLTFSGIPLGSGIGLIVCCLVICCSDCVLCQTYPHRTTSPDACHPHLLIPIPHVDSWTAGP